MSRDSGKIHTIKFSSAKLSELKAAYIMKANEHKPLILCAI